MEEISPIFHIGYHKTGTTWLQKSVWPNVSTHRYIPRKIVRQALLAPYGLEFDPESARRLLEMNSDGRPILVSEENLSGYPHTGGLHGLMAKEVAQRIRKIYPDAKILIAIRNQYDMIRACYSQYIKGGGTLNIDKYINNTDKTKALRHNFKNPSFELNQFNYINIINYYIENFGNQNVTVYPYEKSIGNVEFIKLLIYSLGVKIEEDISMEKIFNKSYSSQCIYLGRFLNLFRIGWVSNKYYLFNFSFVDKYFSSVMDLINKNPMASPDRRVWKSPWAEIIHGTFAQGNREIADRFNLPLAELGYPV